MEWIKTSERLPKVYDPVLVLVPCKVGQLQIVNGNMAVMWLNQAGEWVLGAGSRVHYGLKVTHWTHLPPLPQD